MKKNKTIILIAVVAFVLLASSAFLVVYLMGGGQTRTASKDEVRTFADWTDCEIFQTIPALTANNFHIDEALLVGDGHYSINVNGTKQADYEAYLQVLEDNGFEKYVDNGTDGMYGKVYSVTYTKDDLVLYVIHMVKTCNTYVIATENKPLSDHLFYDDSYVADNKEGAKTTLAMLELWDRGNSFVIQMKNGHFLVCDGAHNEDLEYLLTYMEDRVPEGEKPVIDAWFITHPHDDHADLFRTLSTDQTQADRVYVEGLYYSQLPSQMAADAKVTNICGYIANSVNTLKTTEGKAPEIYRPQAGQKYYFNDITVDVLLTMEQVPEENWHMYTTNINETSPWMVFNIDGQKFLHAGDSEYGGVRAVMRTYDEEDFQFDVLATMHHSIAVYDDFTDFCDIKTVLYTHYGMNGVFKEGQKWNGSWQANTAENEYLHQSVLEYMCYGDGSKVLTFPYNVGEAESLPIRGERMEITGNDKEWKIEY